MFERIDMVEKIGSGISRIYDAMSDAGLPEPIFRTEGIFTVAFFRSPKNSGKSSGKSSGKGSPETWMEIEEKIIQESPVKLGKSAVKILEMVYKNKNISIPEMSKKLRITERAVEKNIQKLKSYNLLKRKDGERAGYWKIVLIK